MPTESKVLRMFRLLTDKYDVKVGINGLREGGERSLVLNVTDHGMKFAFDLKNDNYRKFLMSVAKEELGETLSSKNIGDLNLQLESIAQVMNTADVCEKGCGCGCKIGETLDDE